MRKDPKLLKSTKKKPYSLLVYLALESIGVDKPVSRLEIQNFIQQRFGVVVSMKAISDSADVLRALSFDENPVVAFHTNGKSGYSLGRCVKKSLFTKGESFCLLSCFYDISKEAGDVLFEKIRPYITDQDAELIKVVRQNSPSYKKQANLDESNYFETVSKICQFINNHQEFSFTHHFLDSKGFEIKEERNVTISPFYLFLKNGHLYLFGAQVKAHQYKDGNWETLIYIADVAHISEVRVSSEESICLKDFEQGRHFDFSLFFESLQFVPEGICSRISFRGYLVKFSSSEEIFKTQAIFGDCVEIISKNKDNGTYLARLHMNYSSLLAWAILFGWKGKVLKDGDRDWRYEYFLYDIKLKSSRGFDPYDDTNQCVPSNKK